MNENKLLPDDPKLTAFALGELEGAELAAIEAALRDNAEARAAVAQIRDLAAHLEEALSGEVAPVIRPPQSARVKGALQANEAQPAAESGAPPPSKSEYEHRERAPLLRFPQLYFLIGGLAAACFAVVLALRNPIAVKETRTTQVVPMALPKSETVLMEFPENEADETVASGEATASTSITDPAPIERKNVFDLKASGLLEQPFARSKSWATNAETPPSAAMATALPPVFGLSYGESAAVLGAPAGPASRLGRTRAHFTASQKRLRADHRPATAARGRPDGFLPSDGKPSILNRARRCRDRPGALRNER